MFIRFNSLNYLLVYLSLSSTPSPILSSNCYHFNILLSWKQPCLIFSLQILLFCLLHGVPIMKASTNIMENMVSDSNHAISFKLIRRAKDLNDDSLAFKPVMSHQVFGPHETIYGYKNLQVNLNFSASALNPYIQIKYSEKVDPAVDRCVAADDVKGILSQELGIALSENQDEFIKSLEKEVKFKPPGQMIYGFQQSLESSTGDHERRFEVYQSDVTTPGLAQYHSRLQTFLLWYIDAASYIDADDDKWTFFLLFEKAKVDGEDIYAIAGYSTVYQYYAYPSNVRPRISQMLILPPFQRNGLGAKLLESIYYYFTPNPKVVDITVEDPSEELQLVRDFVDCKNCQMMHCFQPSQLWTLGFSTQLISEAKKKLKINKKQARRVYEILKLRSVDKMDLVQYKEYRVEVKRRLNIPFHHEQTKLRKLQVLMKPQELADLQATMLLTDEQRLLNLDKCYRELEQLYHRVIRRLCNE